MIKLRNIIKEFKQGRTMSIFDFDDTLVKSDAWIYITHSNGKTTKLDPAEYAIYKPKPGDTFDFKDFNKMLRNPKLIKKNVALLKKQLQKARKTSGRQVTILTARKLGYPIKHFFKTLGMDVYVVPVASNDPKLKADWIEKKIQSGYTTIYFMDDSAKNVKAVRSLGNKYPDINLTVTKV